MQRNRIKSLVAAATITTTMVATPVISGAAENPAATAPAQGNPAATAPAQVTPPAAAPTATPKSDIAKETDKKAVDAVNGKSNTKPTPPSKWTKDDSYTGENQLTGVEGDILVDNDTESAADHVITKEEQKIKVQGQLDISVVKKQIKNVEKKYMNIGQQFNLVLTPEAIKVSNIETAFSTAIKLPKGITPPMDGKGNIDISKIKLNDKASGYYRITGAKYENGIVVVSMEFEKVGLDNFKKLSDKINKEPDMLEVSFDADFKAIKGTEKYVMMGSVFGKFKAEAEALGQKLPFNFEWEAVQKISGKDHLNDKGISYTIVYKPEDKKPEDKKPEDKKPEDKKPEDKKPEDKKPEDKKPEDKKPEDKKPEDKKPEDKKPEDKKPEDKKTEKPNKNDKKDNGKKKNVVKKKVEVKKAVKAKTPNTGDTNDLLALEGTIGLALAGLGLTIARRKKNN